MKQLDNYIFEKLKISSKSRVYNYFPETQSQLLKIVKDLIEKRGYDADLNDIDTSKITNMRALFNYSEIYANFNGDISKWNVSNVKDMRAMFFGSKFNGDLSNWDVSKVKDMSMMFCYSKFTGENGDISNWDVSKVENMNNMFSRSDFNQNIDNWDVSNVEDMQYMFLACPLKNKPSWYKE